MSVSLSDFIVNVKRACNYGDESVTDDSPTLDIVQSLNRRREEIAKAALWEWLIESFSVAITVGVQDITLSATISRLIAIGNNDGDYLRKVSIKEMLLYHTPSTGETDTNVIGYWAPMGRDADTHAKKIKVLGLPNASGTFTAYGEKVLTKFALGDIASGELDPFPDSMEQVQQDYVEADVEKIQGKPEWRTDLKLADMKLVEVVGREVSDPADDVTSPLPEFYRVRRILKRAGYAV